MTDFSNRIERAIRAGTRVIAIVTGEEARALALVEAIGGRLDWPVHTWSAGVGIDGGGRDRDIGSLLARLHDRERAAAEIWIGYDVCASLRDPGDRRRLRELAQRSDGPTLILIEPRVAAGLIDVPELVIETLPLPELGDLAERVRSVARVLESPSHARVLMDEADALARIGLGLELDGFDRLLAEGLLAGPANASALRAWLTRRKPDRLIRGGLLEPLDAVPIAELGGLDRYVAWLGRRCLALDPAARAAGIPAPRGALLVGVQGCGKSLAARATADRLGLPLIRLDLARLFGGTVGESEENLRRATLTLERMAPIVLWLDEIDKGLAGFEGSRSDAGTAARVVGSLLTWLQERERPVFVVATANSVHSLPPELLRRGRLDELFFVDLPDRDARGIILAIHLLGRPERELGEIPPLAGPSEAFVELAMAADGFSGAEIESALIEARLDAFARGEPVAAADFDRALRSTVPLARSHAEAIDALRRWAETRARRA